VIVEWDSVKAVSNRKKHGVDFHEAGTVLGDPLSTTFPDPAHSAEEKRYITNRCLGVRAYPCGCAHRPWSGRSHYQRPASHSSRAKVL
jgi:hypothetical protein